MKDLKDIVAENIINLRTLSQMTQFELGEKLNYSDKAISKWERAEAIPSAYILKQMSELFHVTVDYILSDHSNEVIKPLPQPRTNYKTITKISIVGVWTAAITIFVILCLSGYAGWMVFIYALPVSLIVQLVFNSIWGKLKNNFYIISALVWSIIVAIYLSFLQFNWWLLFLIGVPAEIIIYLCHKELLKTARPE